MNEFYVYLHHYADTLVPFYVGKGRGGRAWQLGANRNQRWHDAVGERKVIVEVVKGGLENWQALIEECRIISLLTVAGYPIINKVNVVLPRNVRHFIRFYEGELQYRWRNVAVPGSAVCVSVNQLARENCANVDELNAVLDGKIAITSDGWVSNEDY